MLQVNDFTSEATPILWKAMKSDDPWAKGLAVKGLLGMKEASGKYQLLSLKGPLLTDYFLLESSQS